MAATGTGGGGSPPSNGGEGANKAIAAGLGGAVATIGVYVIDQVTGRALPPEIVAAVQTVVVTLLVFFIPRKFGG